MTRGHSLHTAPEPAIPPGAHEVLAELARVASRAAADAWAGHTRDELLQITMDGADGTPSYLLDELVEGPIVEACRRMRVNLISEEAGVVDVGGVRTVFVDPLDGSANAGAGVPLSCFSGALVEDGRLTSALTCWLETGHVTSVNAGEPTALRTTGRRELAGAAVDMLRPKLGDLGRSDRGFLAVADRAARVRILSSSCLEAVLVAEGAIDAFVDPGSDTHRIVDLAAAMLLVPAAGGAVVDAYGRPLELSMDLTRRWSGVVAATPELAAELSETIERALPRQLGVLETTAGLVALRRARAADVPTIRALLDDIAITQGGGDDDALAAFDRLDRSALDLLLVAEDAAGEVVATLQYTLQPGIAYTALTRAQLEGFAVRADQRGSGIGAAMVGWVVERAKADGAGMIQLTSNLRRERAIAFYERLGFEHSHAGMKLTLS